MNYTIKEIELNKDYVVITFSNSSLEVVKQKIHAVAFANYFFIKGSILNEEMYNDLLNESKYYEIKDLIIKKLKTKDYSKKEVIDILRDKYNFLYIDRLIKDLEKNNYLNDYNYVKNIFYIAQNKLKGKLFIEEKLKDKDIDKNIIDGFFANYDEGYLANKLVDIEYKKIKEKYPKNILINKLGYKLRYNGFNEELIYSILQKFESIKNTVDEDLIKKDYIKLKKKYENKYQNRELKRKVIESLLLKGYNYKSVKEIVEGKIDDNDD